MSLPFVLRFIRALSQGLTNFGNGLRRSAQLPKLELRSLAKFPALFNVRNLCRFKVENALLL